MLIDQVLKSEVDDQAAVTPPKCKAYYDKNPAQFQCRKRSPSRASRSSRL